MNWNLIRGRARWSKAISVIKREMNHSEQCWSMTFYLGLITDAVCSGSSNLHQERLQTPRIWREKIVKWDILTGLNSKSSAKTGRSSEERPAKDAGGRRLEPLVFPRPKIYVSSKGALFDIMGCREVWECHSVPSEYCRLMRNAPRAGFAYSA